MRIEETSNFSSCGVEGEAGEVKVVEWMERCLCWTTHELRAECRAKVQTSGRRIGFKGL